MEKKYGKIIGAQKRHSPEISINQVEQNIYNTMDLSIHNIYYI